MIILWWWDGGSDAHDPWRVLDNALMVVVWVRAGSRWNQNEGCLNWTSTLDCG